MKFCIEDKDMLNSAIAQLKALGIIVPKIKRMKTTISKQNKKPKKFKKVFGVGLADQEQLHSNTPKFILSCTEYLQKYSKEMGLFRKAGSISRQKKLRLKIENGDSLEDAEPNDVASLLKQWLRELPESLVPSYLHDSFICCQQLNESSRATAILLLCLLLPPEHLMTLKHLMDFLADIALHKNVNKMDIDNLALIMTPNVFVLSNTSIDITSLKIKQLTEITKLLIANASKIGEIPPSLIFKFPIQESLCKSDTNSLGEGSESSPSLSRKHYLLRSIKRLVRQNGTSNVNSTLTPAGGHNFLRPTLSVSNMEKSSLKSISENKGGFNFFGSRNPEDVCKRSFRLLRKKDKRGFNGNQDFHPFTQSLEIQRPMTYQIEIDDIKIFPSNQDIEEESTSGGLFNYNSFEDNHHVLEDIEMTTFNTLLNEPSDHLVAFPMFSQPIQSKKVASKEENQNEENCIKNCFSENINNFSNRKVSLFQNLMVDNSDSYEISSSSKINASKTQCLNADPDRPGKVLNKNCAEVADAYQLLRQTTFVIEPCQNTIPGSIKRPCIDEHKCKSFIKVNNFEGDGVSCKRQCTNMSIKNKTTDKNEYVKTPSKTVNSGKSSVKRNKSVKLTLPAKGNRTIKDLKVFHDDSPPSHVQSETINLRSSSKREELDITPITLAPCPTKGKFSENTETVPNMYLEKNLVPKRKLSFTRYPVTSASHSDSKIPRLRNSFEVSATNSFCEEAASQTRKVIKPKSFKTPGSKEGNTRIPIKCNDSRNLSTLELSMNDSCFLTPRRNEGLSPNSIVWMSGRRYLDSKSPEESAFNKRESIAMILKTNSGHVQAKVHLYDDLVRESVDTPSKASHSTPTSKLSRSSLSSQSMKATPKLRKHTSNDKCTPKKLSISRSSSLKNENSLKSFQPKFILHTDAPSPIKSLSLKDVTNTSLGSKSSINNLKVEKENGARNRKKLKHNSFSGNNSKKFVKKISRSESSPGCQRPYHKVTSLQVSNCD